MKKLFLMILGLVMAVSAFADWSYGTANFRGNKPSNSRSIGTVQVWYNGSLRQTGSSGNTEYWEATGDVCVVFPKNYSGKQLKFSSKGGSVQVEYLR